MANIELFPGANLPKNSNLYFGKNSSGITISQKKAYRQNTNSMLYYFQSEFKQAVLLWNDLTSAQKLAWTYFAENYYLAHFWRVRGSKVGYNAFISCTTTALYFNKVKNGVLVADGFGPFSAWDSLNFEYNPVPNNGYHNFFFHRISDGMDMPNEISNVQWSGDIDDDIHLRIWCWPDTIFPGTITPYDSSMASPANFWGWNVCVSEPAEQPEFININKQGLVLGVWDIPGTFLRPDNFKNTVIVDYSGKPRKLLSDIKTKYKKGDYVRFFVRFVSRNGFTWRAWDYDTQIS